MYPAFRAASQKMRSGSEAGSLALRDAKVRGFESLRAIFLCPFRQRGFLRVYWCIENRSAFCYTCLKVGERRAKREKNDRSAAPGKAIAPPCAGQNKDHGYHDYLRVNELKFYDLHCHTSGISRCCRLNSEEILSKAKEVGYDGIVLTNHYTQGYLDGRDYSVFAEEYIAEYEKAKAQGEKIGVEVIFGVELTYEISPKIHILLYGATPDFIRQNREMYLLDSRALYELCHKNGICVIHAHPFRGGTQPLPYTDCDGYEINCHPLYGNTNSKEIIQMQKERGFIVTCGCDFHGDTYRSEGGTYIPDDVKDEGDLAKFLLTAKEIHMRVNEINPSEIKEYSFKIG